MCKTTKTSPKIAGIVTRMWRALPGQPGGSNLLIANDLTIIYCPLVQIKGRCIHCACVSAFNNTHICEKWNHDFPAFWVLPLRFIPIYSNSGFPTKILHSFIFSTRTFSQVYRYGMCYRTQTNKSLRTSVTATRSSFVICAFLVAPECEGEEIYKSGHLRRCSKRRKMFPGFICYLKRGKFCSHNGGPLDVAVWCLGAWQD